MSETADRARENGLLGARFADGEQLDPAACAAQVIAEQALSILEGAEASASEIRDRGQRQADAVVAAAHDAAALALSRLHAMSAELDGLETELDHNLATRQEHGHGE